MSKKKNKSTSRNITAERCVTHSFACDCRENRIAKIRTIIGDALAMLIRADCMMDELYGEEKFK